MTSPYRRTAPDVTTQGERTHLAWQRTGLSFLGVGALLVHVAGGLSQPLAAAPGLLGMAASAVIFVRAAVRYRTGTAATGGTAARGIAALAATAGLLSVAGLLLVLVTD